MATDIGEVAIKLTLQGDISKQAQKLASSAGSALGKIGSVAATVGKAVATGMAAGTAGVVALTKSVITAYADWEQLIGGVETLFKDSASIVDQYAQQAYKTAGLSANQYMETVTGFSASLLQSLGGDTAKAAEYGNRAVIDMSDNANKMGTDISRIQDAYQGFAKQNYTMLDNLKLGYGGTKTEMERLLSDAEKISGMKFNIDSFADITQAIHIVQESMGIAGTTAKEAEETISGSLNMVKSSWSNVLAAMGGGTTMDLEATFSALVDGVRTLVTNLMPVIKSALVNIAELIKDLAPIIVEEVPPIINDILPVLIEAATTIVVGLAKALPGLISTLVSSLLDVAPKLIDGIGEVVSLLTAAISNNLPTLIQKAVEVIQKLGEAIVTNFPVLVQALLDAIPGIIDGIITMVDAIVEQLPTILPLIIEGLVTLVLAIAEAITRPDFLQTILEAAITLFMSLVEALPDVLTALIGALPNIISNVIAFLTDPGTIMMLINAAIQLFFALVKAVPQILGALIGAFNTLVGNLIGNLINMFVKFAANFGEMVGGVFKNVVNGVLGFIEGLINGPINVLNGFIDMINGAFGIIGVNLGHIGNINLPRLAAGGMVVGPGTATSDSIPALLSNGEYVINARAAQSIGYENLDQLNHTGSLGLIESAIRVDDGDYRNDSNGSGREIVVNMQNYINNKLDAMEIGQLMTTSIRRAT